MTILYNPYNWTILSSKEYEEKRLSEQWAKKMAELSIARMKCEILEKECEDLREQIRNLYI